MINCTQCGSPMTETSKFCGNCGASAQPPQPEAFTPPTPPQPPQPEAFIPPTPPQPPQPEVFTPPTPPQPPQPEAFTPPTPSQPPQPEAFIPPTPSQPPQPEVFIPPTPPQPPQPEAFTPPTPPQPTPSQPKPHPFSAPQGQQQPFNPPQQQPFAAPPQGQPPSTKTAVATKKPPIILFIGIGVVVITLIIVGIIMIPKIFSGTNSDDPNIGVWQATEITMMGMTMAPEDIYSNGITLELKAGNDCVLTLDGQPFAGTWSVDGSNLTINQGFDEYSAKITNGKLMLVNTLNMGLDITFVKEGTSSDDSALEGGNDNDEDISVPSADFVAPGYGSEETILVETLSNHTQWYGIVTIENYSGNDDISGEYEAWGYIDTDESGNYFEVYINDSAYGDGDGIISFNIELHDYTFFPIVDEHAFLYGGAPLREEDATWYTPTLTSGVLSATYEYSYNGESFTLTYQLSQIADSGDASVENDDSSVENDDSSAETDDALIPQNEGEGFSLNFLNRMPNDIVELYVKDQNSDDYGANLLSQPIPKYDPNEVAASEVNYSYEIDLFINLPVGEDYKYLVKIITSSGEEFEYSAQPLWNFSFFQFNESGTRTLM